MNIKNTVINDLRGEHLPDSSAKNLLERTFAPWLPYRLREQMKNSLCGLSEVMALEVADDLLDCWTFGVRHYTNIDYIDRMLHSLYNKILYCAWQQGIELPNHF